MKGFYGIFRLKKSLDFYLYLKGHPEFISGFITACKPKAQFAA
jgi:hypothetical protein